MLSASTPTDLPVGAMALPCPMCVPEPTQRTTTRRWEMWRLTDHVINANQARVAAGHDSLHRLCVLPEQPLCVAAGRGSKRLLEEGV
jgi:hypothetical protein